MLEYIDYRFITISLGILLIFYIVSQGISNEPFFFIWHELVWLIHISSIKWTAVESRNILVNDIFIVFHLVDDWNECIYLWFRKYSWMEFTISNMGSIDFQYGSICIFTAVNRLLAIKWPWYAVYFYDFAHKTTHAYWSWSIFMSTLSSFISEEKCWTYNNRLRSLKSFFMLFGENLLILGKFLRFFLHPRFFCIHFLLGFRAFLVQKGSSGFLVFWPFMAFYGSFLAILDIFPSSALQDGLIGLPSYFVFFGLFWLSSFDI